MMNIMKNKKYIVEPTQKKKNLYTRTVSCLLKGKCEECNNMVKLDEILCVEKRFCINAFIYIF